MISRDQIDRVEYVPNDALRAQVVRQVNSGDLNWHILARELGHYRDGRPETLRVKRALGHTANNKSRQRYMKYDLAVKIVEALGLDPVDYGV